MEGAGEGGGSREGRPRGPTMVWRREEDMAWMLKLAHSYIMVSVVGEGTGVERA